MSGTSKKSVAQVCDEYDALAARLGMRPVKRPYKSAAAGLEALCTSMRLRLASYELVNADYALDGSASGLVRAEQTYVRADHVKAKAKAKAKGSLEAMSHSMRLQRASYELVNANYALHQPFPKPSTPAEQTDAQADHAEAKAKADKPKRARRPAGSPPEPRVKRTDTVVATAMNLLARVAYYEDKTLDPSDDNRVEANHPNARSVGLTYSEVLTLVLEAHPGAKTTNACLRWYVGRVNQGDASYTQWKMPGRRPRG